MNNWELSELKKQAAKLNEKITIEENKILVANLKYSQYVGKYFMYKYSNDRKYCYYIKKLNDVSMVNRNYLVDIIIIDDDTNIMAKLNIKESLWREDDWVETNKEQFDYYFSLLLNTKNNNLSKVKTFFRFSLLAKLVFFAQSSMVFAFLILSLKNDFYILKSLILLSNLVFLYYWGIYYKNKYKF